MPTPTHYLKLLPNHFHLFKYFLSSMKMRNSAKFFPYVLLLLLQHSSHATDCVICANDAYKAGHAQAKHGCWGCACMDGRRMCGCWYCNNPAAPPAPDPSSAGN